jgi:hypothetical protein
MKSTAADRAYYEAPLEYVIDRVADRIDSDADRVFIARGMQIDIDNDDAPTDLNLTTMAENVQRWCAQGRLQ